MEVWTWVVGHSALVAGLGVAVLDFVFAINPKVDSNGAIHWVYLQLKKFTGPTPPQA